MGFRRYSVSIIEIIIGILGGINRKKDIYDGIYGMCEDLEENW